MDEGDEVRGRVDRCRRDHHAWVNGDASGDDMSPAGGVRAGRQMDCSFATLLRPCESPWSASCRPLTAWPVGKLLHVATGPGPMASSLCRDCRAGVERVARVGMAASNWAGNYEYRAERLHRPVTLEQVQEIVAAARHAAGARLAPLVQRGRRLD